MASSNILEQYALLTRLLLEDKVCLDSALTFRKVCSWLGADPEALDDYVNQQLGLDGQGLMRHYRRQELIRLREKYRGHLPGFDPWAERQLRPRSKDYPGLCWY